MYSISHVVRSRHHVSTTFIFSLPSAISSIRDLWYWYMMYILLCTRILFLRYSKTTYISLFYFFKQSLKAYAGSSFPRFWTRFARDLQHRVRCLQFFQAMFCPCVRKLRIQSTDFVLPARYKCGSKLCWLHKESTCSASSSGLMRASYGDARCSFAVQTIS